MPFCLITLTDVVICKLVMGFFHYPGHLFKKRARGVIITPTSNGVIMVRRMSRRRCFRSHHLVVSVFVDMLGIRTG